MALDPNILMQSVLGNIGQGYAGMRQVQQDQAAQQNQAQQYQMGQQQLAAAAAAQEQQQAYGRDVQGWIDGGSKPEGLVSLAARYPQQANALKDAWKIKDDATKQADLGWFGGVYSAADNGRADLVRKEIKARRDAEAGVGADTGELDDLLTQFDTDPEGALKTAKAASLAHIYAGDPDKFSTAFNLGKDKTHVVGPNDTLTDDSGNVLYKAPDKPEYKVMRNGDGSESLVQVGGGGQASGAGGAPSAPSPAPSKPWTSEQLASAVPFGGRVTSGYRTPAHNAAIGGAPNSQHVADRAIDVVFPKGVTTDQVKAYYADKGASVQVIHENAGDPYSTGDHFHIQYGRQGAPPQTSQAKFNDTGTRVLYTSKGNPGGASGSAPSGYRFKGDGTLEPIPGGPADADQLDKDTIATMAQQYLAGDKSVLQNLGRSNKGASTVARVRIEIAKQAKAAGMSGRDIAAQMADFSGVMASERATGTRIAQIELAATEAQKLAPLALAASDALPRNGFVPFSRAEQAIRSGTNSPALRRFVTANQGLVNTYSRAVSPTGTPTVDSQQHARQMLDTAYDQNSYRAVVQQMMKEIAAARQAPAQVRNELRANVGGGIGAPAGDKSALKQKYGLK